MEFVVWCWAVVVCGLHVSAGVHGREIGGTPRVEIPTLGKMLGTKELSGTGSNPYTAFRGIPYAHPPVGNNRFKPPEIHYAWPGILNASSYGPDCMQPSKIRGTSEDCLTLNVFVPRQVTQGSQLPVFVFVRGGGFMNGGGSIEPDNLMDRGDIVLVTLNFRLGPFGLFTRAMSMSGSALAPWALRRNPRADALYLGSSLGCNDPNPKALVACLKEQPAEEIIKVQKKMTGSSGSAFHFVPVVDKHVLPDTPEILISKRKVQPVPWLTGRVRDEGLMGFTEEILFSPENLKKVDANWISYCPSLLEFQELDSERAAKRCAAIREFYFRERPIDYDSTYDFLEMIGDRWFELPYAFSITFHSMIATTFGYKFNYQGSFAPINTLYVKAVGMGQKSIIGAVAHGDDMQFLFYNEKKTHHRDAAVAKAFTDMVESFVVYGEPKYVGTANGKGGYSMKWRPYDAISGDFVHQLVDYPVRLETAEEITNKIHFWEDVLTDKFSHPSKAGIQMTEHISVKSAPTGAPDNSAALPAAAHSFQNYSSIEQ
ncbi:unnamed protein product [Notodromas monacha]|uniref:Carboxylesterase type B domain-containing protein n=1 Tax=Notodromas monacha TaxID=399045 RepID=A0A7R9BQN7_9CRUS|nr:unnamed protein product [Notodromas monacha]CAG0919920.1 unnamed protein product [Notodromas monacha]